MNLMTLRIAWCNLWRHPQRTALMIATVAFGSFVIILFWGVTDGWLDTMTHVQTTLDQGDLKVFAAGYRDDPVPEHGLTAEQLQQAMAAIGEMRSASSASRLVLFGMLKSAYGATGMEIRGIDLARAVVSEPAIVLADEPTANLDTATSLDLIGLMRRLNEDKGATFLFATHDRRLHDQVSRLLTLEDGRITQDQCR